MNCYICGHPILEGQEARAALDIKIMAPRASLLVHLNPADHLPTLYRDEIAWKMVAEERERAAKIVEDTFHMTSPKISEESVANITFGDLKKLAARIRGDDEL